MRSAAAILGLTIAAFWAAPALAQLTYVVHTPERCEPISHEIARRVLYHRKLRVEQDHWNRQRRQVSPSAGPILAELDRWAPGYQRDVARQCRAFGPTRNRPWVFEWAEPRRH